MRDIVLTTCNARYIHSAFGLRYLKANLGVLQARCVIEEFTVEQRTFEVVERLLSHQPAIIGFGVYIWNIEQTLRIVALLKRLQPKLSICLGGPEVSHADKSDSLLNDLFDLADHIISSWGEQSFRQLCEAKLVTNKPMDKFLPSEMVPLSQIKMPYQLYDDNDIANRLIYVEASRGCPFKCSFCLSALDKTAWAFDLEQFLKAMDELYLRGARNFKFVDRTFNLKTASCLRILDFFLERMDENLFLHFEIIPDRLPDEIKRKLTEFSPGVLQFEIGVQTFTEQVQHNIQRRQDNQRTKDNIAWLRKHSNAHLHTDLIYGLPGETNESFASSFNQLYALRPHEIQVGLLKKLKGSPLVNDVQNYSMKFDPNPPYTLIANDTVDFSDVMRMTRFARYWDLIGNSGRFRKTLPLFLVGDPFADFSRISQALYRRCGRTHKISLNRLFDLLFEIGRTDFEISTERLIKAISADFERSGLKSIPKYLQQQLRPSKKMPNKKVKSLQKRQVQHQ